MKSIKLIALCCVISLLQPYSSFAMTKNPTFSSCSHLLSLYSQDKRITYFLKQLVQMPTSEKAIEGYFKDYKYLSESLSSIYIYSFLSSSQNGRQYRKGWKGYMMVSNDRILKVFISPENTAQYSYAQYRGTQDGWYESTTLSSHEPKLEGKKRGFIMIGLENGQTVISSTNKEILEHWEAL